jgi:small-conductance mechanosensitive channel
VRWALTEAGKKRLEAAGLTIPFPQQVVHLVGSDGQPAPQATLATPE